MANVPDKHLFAWVVIDFIAKLQIMVHFGPFVDCRAPSLQLLKTITNSVPNLNRDEISYNQLQEMALFFYGALGVKIVFRGGEGSRG